MTNNDPSNQAMTKSNVKSKFLLVDILTKINQGETPAEMSKRMGWTRQRLRYWIKKLEKSGMIKLRTRSAMNIYELSDEGKKMTTGSGSWSTGGITLHHVEYSYPIVRMGNLNPDKVWEASGVKMWFERVDSKTSVSGNPKSVQVKVQKLYGSDAFKLQDEAKNLADRCVSILRTRGFEFGQGEQTKKPHFGVMDPMLRNIKERMQIRTEDGEVDSSGDEDMEPYTPEAVANYMKMPQRIARLEEVMVKFAESMETYNRNIEMHLEVMRKIGDYFDKLKEAQK